MFSDSLSVAGGDEGKNLSSEAVLFVSGKFATFIVIFSADRESINLVWKSLKGVLLIDKANPRLHEACCDLTSVEFDCRRLVAKG